MSIDVNEPLKRITNPENIVDKLIRAERQSDAGASANVESGDELFNNMGSQYGGDIIGASPDATSNDPSDAGFSGAGISPEGKEFPEGTMKIYAVTEGGLNFGVRENGTVVAPSIELTLNGGDLDAAVVLTEEGWAVSQDVTVGSEVREMRFGVISNGTNGESIWKQTEPGGAVSIPDGDFEALTGWTQTAGTWTLVDWGDATYYARGVASSVIKPTLTSAAKFAVTAGTSYRFSVYNNFGCTFTYTVGATVTMTVKFDVKFYTAGDALVSTENIASRSASVTVSTPPSPTLGSISASWGTSEKDIVAPATATQAEFVFYVDASPSGTKNLYLDDASCVASGAAHYVKMKDGGIYFKDNGKPETGLATLISSPYANGLKTDISTSGETRTFSLSIPADFFDSGFIRFEVWAQVVTTTARNLTARVKFGNTAFTTGTRVLTVALNTDARYFFEGVISKTGSDTQRIKLQTSYYNETATSDARFLDYWDAAYADGAELTLEFSLQLSGAVTSGTYLGVKVDRILNNTEWGSTRYFSTLAPADDTYISSGSAATNFSAAEVLGIGESNTSSAIFRTWMKPAFTGIPVGATIVAAKLYMVVTADASSNARTIYVHRCLRAVVAAQVTYNVYSTGNAWGTVGCKDSTNDYDGAVVIGTAAQAASPSIGTIITITLDAAEMQKLFDGTNTNNGLIMFVDTETNDEIVYGSNENTTASNRPYIEYVYTV